MTRPPRKCRMVMPGSVVAVPLAGTPMNSSTCPAGHGEPDAGHVAIPQHLVELELRRVKGAEYPRVEAADLVLVHGPGGVARARRSPRCTRSGTRPGRTRPRGPLPAYFTCRGP